MQKAIHLSVKEKWGDNEWDLEYIDHDRNVVRAIVFDEDGFFYFVRVERDDVFGHAVVIETSGGGVEPNEDFDQAILRELKEEQGANVEIVCRIGTVSDYYNLIHRHNINNYYLCKAVSFGERHLMEYEKQQFHMATLRLNWKEALDEYEKCKKTPLGRLIAQREVPILHRAKEIIDGLRRNIL